MKFKAEITGHGLRLLEKGILPTLEKFGKTCQLLLGPEDVHLLQTAVNTDGAHTVVRLANEAIFEANSLRLESKHHNLIAFGLELALLSRVLRAAGANDADLLEVKLALKNVPSGTDGATHSRPFLTFTSQGANLNMVQDLPITKPFVAEEIDKLSREKDLAQLCPYYINLQGEVPRLQGLVDKSKGISSSITLVTTKGGAIHIQVDGGSVQLACEMQGLQVFPASVAETAIQPTATSAEARLKEAIENGQTASVCLLAKHFGKSLQGGQLTQPAQLLCGIGEKLGYVHLLFIFRDPFSEGGYDDNMGLSFKLPVRDDS